MQEFHHFPQCDDDSIPGDNLVAQYWTFIHQGLAALNIDFSAVLSLQDKMRHAGFANVSVRVLRIPIGEWHKNKALRVTGLCWKEILLWGMEAIALGPLTRGLKWTRKEVDLYLDPVRQAYEDNECHSYMPFYVIYGQKPEE